MVEDKHRETSGNLSCILTLETFLYRLFFTNVQSNVYTTNNVMIFRLNMQIKTGIMAKLRQRFCSIKDFVMPSNLVLNVKFSPYIRVYKYVIMLKLIFVCVFEKHNGILL